MSKLDDVIQELQSDKTATLQFISGQASQIGDLKAQLAASQAAGTPPTDEQIAALESIHSAFQAVIAPAAPPA